MKHNRTYRKIRRSSRRTKKQRHSRGTTIRSRRLGTIRRRGGATIHDVSCDASICVPIFKE
jgi:hypothetical protein